MSAPCPPAHASPRWGGRPSPRRPGRERGTRAGGARGDGEAPPPAARRTLSSGLAHLLLLAALAQPAAAHPFHASYAEADHRPACRCLEVALKVIPEDLESALAPAGGRVPLEPAATDPAILAYLVERFVVTAGGETLPLAWVGKQVDAREAWLYFEVREVDPDADLTIADRILFEVEPAQVNHLLLRAGERRQSLAFRPGDPPQTVRLGALGPVPAAPE